MGPLHLLTDATQFRNGVVAGICVVAAVSLVAFGTRRRSLPLAGAAFAAGACVALDRSGVLARAGHLPVGMIAGVVLAGVCAELAGWVWANPALVALAALPGAVVTAGAVVGADVWARLAVVGFAAAGGALVADFDRHDRLGVAPALWLATVAGVYWTVPDTEAARAVLGVAIVVAVLGRPLRLARFGTGGAVASACVLGWVIGQGGYPRPGAVIGGVATIGLFAWEPLVRRLRPHERVVFDARPWLLAAYLASVHAACVATGSRWAGLAHDRGPAALRVLVFAPLALALTFAIAPVSEVLADRESPRPRHPRGGRRSSSRTP